MGFESLSAHQVKTFDFSKVFLFLALAKNSIISSNCFCELRYLQNLKHWFIPYIYCKRFARGVVYRKRILAETPRHQGF